MIAPTRQPATSAPSSSPGQPTVLSTCTVPLGRLESAGMQPNHCSGQTEPSTSAIQARMFASTTIYLVQRYRPARAKGRARIGRQRTEVDVLCGSSSHRWGRGGSTISVTAFLYARMFAGQVRAGGLAQRSQQRGCVVGASKEARWTTLVRRGAAAPIHRPVKSAPSSGPSFSCRLLPSLRCICEVTGETTLCVL